MKNEKKAFISYSHKDKRYCELLIEGLKSHSLHSHVFDWNLWDDRKIEIGYDWHNHIQEQITLCDFAILLISPDFFYSDYISEYELNVFFKRNKDEEQFFFFPVLIRDFDYKRINWLSKNNFL